MTDFIKDTILIDEKLNLEMPEFENTPLNAIILPFYIDPNSMDLMVVMKRCLLPAGFKRTGRRMGISALTMELPEEEHITVEEVYARLNLPAKMQEAIPYGNVMLDPLTSTRSFEMILIQIDPIAMLDKKRGIVYQEKGKYEIGAIRFSDIMEGIATLVITDLKTRLILNELYILALEQGNNAPPQQVLTDPEKIGGGANLPPGFGEQKETVKTSDIPDEVIAQNAQKDFGAIYSRAVPSANTEFVPIQKPSE